MYSLEIFYILCMGYLIAIWRLPRNYIATVCELSMDSMNIFDRIFHLFFLMSCVVLSVANIAHRFGTLKRRGLYLKNVKVVQDFLFNKKKNKKGKQNRKKGVKKFSLRGPGSTFFGKKVRAIFPKYKNASCEFSMVANDFE